MTRLIFVLHVILGYQETIMTSYYLKNSILKLLAAYKVRTYRLMLTIRRMDFLSRFYNLDLGYIIFACRILMCSLYIGL